MAFTPLFNPAPVRRFTRPTRPGGFTLPAAYAPRESELFERGEGIRRMFDPRRAALRGNLAERLAGFGGYRFRTDDPATPDDESLLPEYDADLAGRGPREAQAARTVREAYAARGALHSSFAQREEARVLGELARQARAAVGEYQTGLTGLAGEEEQAGTGVYGDLASLYGQAGRHALDNPPVAPAPVAPAPVAPPAPRPVQAFVPSQANNYGANTPVATYKEWLAALVQKPSATMANRWRVYVRQMGGTPPVPRPSGRMK